MKLALQNLLQDKLRFALSVTGIALAVMLILFLLGLREGVFRSAALYLDNAPGSVAVMRLVGYDTALGGGPWNLRQGREPAGDDEVVLDRVLASKHGFSVGDSFEIGGHQLKVVGLSNETSSFSGASGSLPKPSAN